MTNKKPIETIRFGRISAAIWKNTGDHDKVFYSFTLERLYTDKNENLQSSNSFNLQDALTVAKVCNQAHTRIYEMLLADKADTVVDSEQEAD